MNTVIKFLEQEMVMKQKYFYQKGFLKGSKKLSVVLLQEVNELKMAIKVLKQQQLKEERKKYVEL